MNGFVERLQMEMKQIFKTEYKCEPWVKVVAPPERSMSTGIGGSIIASLSTFEEMWITAHEYDDEGSRVVRGRYQLAR